MRRLVLDEGDKIITAFAERATGPGWSNSPVWVIVRSPDGVLRQECMQPDQQTGDMASLYNVSEAAHKAMKSAARLAVSVRKPKAA